MKTAGTDTTYMDRTIRTVESILQHRKAHPTVESDEREYELLLKYLRRIRNAKEDGKHLVAYSAMVPCEILYAMDLIPMQVELVTSTLTLLTGTHEEAFSAAKAYGFAPEICSAHRILNAHCILGTMPRPDAIIWSNQVCDNTTKAGDPVVELLGCPGFFLDRPYRYTESSVEYFTKELEDMIGFLEDVTHRKLDWDRLKEAVRHTGRMIELHREIHDLRKAIPCPTRNRQWLQVNFAEVTFSGAPEAVDFLEHVLEEIKSRVKEKKGYIPDERYRLLQLFVPPTYAWKLMDWMEKEYGAVSVVEPYLFTWGEGEMDPERPLESIARKCFFQPVCRQMHGPMEEGVLADSVDAAVEYNVDGAIFWAHIGCREACACIKMLKDGLREKAGVPTLVVDSDIFDPTYVTKEQIKDKFEGFFELLEDRI